MDFQTETSKSFIHKHKKIFTVGGGLVALAVALVLILPGSIGERERVRATGIETAVVSREPFQETLRFNATVVPGRQRIIEWPVAGRVEELEVESGTLVERGELMVRLESSDLRRAVQRARSQLYEAELAVETSRLNEQLTAARVAERAVAAERELEAARRRVQLLEREAELGTVSDDELAAARADLAFEQSEAEAAARTRELEGELADLALQSRRTALIEATRRLAEAADAIDQLSVTAPASGRLLGLSVAVGQSVSRGARLGTIIDPDDLGLEASVGDFVLESITRGTEGSAVIDGASYRVVAARISSSVEDEERVVRLEIAEPPPDLRVGDRAPVAMRPGSPEDALTVPRGDFFAATGGRWIYRLTDDGNRARRAFIRLGRQNDTRYEVVEGLSEGDRVIVNGYGDLPDADEITLEGEASSQGAAE